MRVAIPVSGGWVERVFDSATTLMVMDLRGGDRGECFETAMSNRSAEGRARELAAMGVDVLLCNEISYSLESLTRSVGVEVRKHHSGRVDEAIGAFVSERDGVRHRSNGQPLAAAATT